MPRNSPMSQYSSSERTERRSERKDDSQNHGRRYRDHGEYDDDQDRRKHVGRHRHYDEDRRSHSRSRSRSRSSSPKRNQSNNIKPVDSKGAAGIQMKLSASTGNPSPLISKPKVLSSPVATKPSSSKLKVASIFNEDDDDEPEEMPPECRMRMKNVGRETPTSAGPNSFGKTKIGFCNVSHIAERKNNN